MFWSCDLQLVVWDERLQLLYKHVAGRHRLHPGVHHRHIWPHQYGFCHIIYILDTCAWPENSSLLGIFGYGLFSDAGGDFPVSEDGLSDLLQRPGLRQLHGHLNWTHHLALHGRGDGRQGLERRHLHPSVVHSADISCHPAYKILARTRRRGRNFHLLRHPQLLGRNIHLHFRRGNKGQNFGRDIGSVPKEEERKWWRVIWDDVIDFGNWKCIMFKLFKIIIYWLTSLFDCFEKEI